MAKHLYDCTCELDGEDANRCPAYKTGQYGCGAQIEYDLNILVKMIPSRQFDTLTTGGVRKAHKAAGAP